MALVSIRLSRQEFVDHYIRSTGNYHQVDALASSGDPANRTVRKINRISIRRTWPYAGRYGTLDSLANVGISFARRNRFTPITAEG